MEHSTEDIPSFRQMRVIPYTNDWVVSYASSRVSSTLTAGSSQCNNSRVIPSANNKASPCSWNCRVIPTARCNHSPWYCAPLPEEAVCRDWVCEDHALHCFVQQLSWDLKRRVHQTRFCMLLYAHTPSPSLLTFTRCTLSHPSSPHL